MTIVCYCAWCMETPGVEPGTAEAAKKKCSVCLGAGANLAYAGEQGKYQHCAWCMETPGVEPGTAQAAKKKCSVCLGTGVARRFMERG